MNKGLRWILQLILTVLFTAIASGVYAAVPVYEANSQASMEAIILEAIKHRENNFRIQYYGEIDNISEKVKEARAKAVAADPYHEGCIALISGFSISVDSGRADISFSQFQYYTTAAQEEYVGQEITRIAGSIFRSGMTDYEQEKAIHNYVIKTISYDNSLAGYTAYSALKNGLTVCNGYVQVVYLLAKEAGLETMIVKGKVKSGSVWKDHAWNLVKLDGKWYHLDPTLNDSLSEPNTVTYPYFNLTDAQIQQDHSFDANAYPDAVVTFTAAAETQTTGSGGGSATNPDLVQEIVVEGKTRAKLNPVAFATVLDSAAIDDEIVVNVSNQGAGYELTIPYQLVRDIIAKSSGLKLRINSGTDSIVVPWNKLDLGKDIIISTNYRADESVKMVITQLGASLVGQVAEIGLRTVDADGNQQELVELGGYIQYSASLSEATPSSLVGVRYEPTLGTLLPVPMIINENGGEQLAIFNIRGSGSLMLLRYKKAFKDMESHWAKIEVQKLASMLIIKGKSAEEFDHQGKVTRAEFAALLVRALGLPDTKKPVSYTDVNQQWYAGAVGQAAAAGLVNGYTDGTFRPQSTVTRQEMAVMVNRALEYVGAKGQSAVPEDFLQRFNDSSDIKAWAKEAVAQNVVAGIVKGSPEGEFKPNAETTRAEAAVILNRTLGYVGFTN